FRTVLDRLVLVVDERFWARFPRLRDDVTALALDNVHLLREGRHGLPARGRGISRGPQLSCFGRGGLRSPRSLTSPEATVTSRKTSPRPSAALPPYLRPGTRPSTRNRPSGPVWMPSLSPAGRAACPAGRGGRTPP